MESKTGVGGLGGVGWVCIVLYYNRLREGIYKSSEEHLTVICHMNMHVTL